MDWVPRCHRTFAPDVRRIARQRGACRGREWSGLQLSDFSRQRPWRLRRRWRFYLVRHRQRRRGIDWREMAALRPVRRARLGRLQQPCLSSRSRWKRVDRHQPRIVALPPATHASFAAAGGAPHRNPLGRNHRLPHRRRMFLLRPLFLRAVLGPHAVQQSRPPLPVSIVKCRPRLGGRSAKRGALSEPAIRRIHV